jgi:hypothetical protein
MLQEIDISSYGFLFNAPSFVSAYDRAGNFIMWNFTLNFMYGLNVSATSLYDGGAAINSFSIYKDGVLEPDYFNTTNGYFFVWNLTENQAYNITIEAPGYEKKSHIYNATTYYNTYNFELQKFNSVNITIYDEATGVQLAQNVSVKFSNNLTEFTNITSTGNLYYYMVPAGEYKILFNSANYSERSYFITIGNYSTQTLKAYLPLNSTTQQTIFTISDKDSSEVLEGVLSSMYRLINGSWEPVESKYTDILGKAQFTYLPLTKYKFYLSKPGYTDYVFYLDPILFTSNY